MQSGNPGFDPISDFLDQKKRNKQERLTVSAVVDSGLKEIEANRRGEIYTKKPREDSDSDDNNEEKYNRFYDPEVAFNKMVQDNKDINRANKDEGKKRKYLQVKSRPLLDESLEMFTGAYHPKTKVFSPPGGRGRYYSERKETK